MRAKLQLDIELALVEFWEDEDGREFLTVNCRALMDATNDLFFKTV